MGQRHSLSEIDETERQAVCVQCGPVPIYRNGRYGWRCAKVQLEYQNQRGQQDSVKESQRHSRLMREFGISSGEYNRLLEAQGGRCARCGGVQETMRLAVDHCHRTGRVRGLLCGPCNTYLGRLEANVDRLSEDLEYLGLAERMPSL